MAPAGALPRHLIDSRVNVGTVFDTLIDMGAIPPLIGVVTGVGSTCSSGAG